MKKVAITIRRFVYLSLSLFDEVFGEKVPDFVVLCYHGISNGVWQHDVEIKSFIRQVNQLSRTRKAASLSDLRSYLKGNKKISTPAFVITFDDGYKSVMSVRNFLKKKGIKPGLFLLADESNANRLELGTHAKFLSIKDIKTLIKDGWEVGSHSSTHPDFSKLTLEQIKYEVKHSKKELEKRLGVKVKYFAFPRGRYTESVVREVKLSKYDLGLTMDDNLINKKTNLFMVPRIGIGKNHSLSEFKGAFSPSVIKLRQILKKYKFDQIYD